MLFQAFVKYFTNFTYDTQFIAKSYYHTAYKCYSVINVLFICCQMTEGSKSLPILLSSGNPLTINLDGDEGTRTPDLLLAKEALSRLSYIPRSHFSGPFRTRT